MPAHRYLFLNEKCLFLFTYCQLSFKSHQRGRDNRSDDRDSWLFFLKKWCWESNNGQMEWSYISVTKLHSPAKKTSVIFKLTCWLGWIFMVLRSRRFNGWSYSKIIMPVHLIICTSLDEHAPYWGFSSFIQIYVLVSFSFVV